MDGPANRYTLLLFVLLPGDAERAPLIADIPGSGETAVVGTEIVQLAVDDIAHRLALAVAGIRLEVQAPVGRVHCRGFYRYGIGPGIDRAGQLCSHPVEYHHDAFLLRSVESPVADPYAAHRMAFLGMRDGCQQQGR